MLNLLGNLMYFTDINVNRG